jgi:hypothetical protein
MEGENKAGKSNNYKGLLERETGIEPATSSLGKRQKIVYQGFSGSGGYRSVPKRTLFTQFPPNDRKWSQNGVTALRILQPPSLHQHPVTTEI